jgi:hypothetical protein
LFISFGLSTKSPLTFFSASAGAAGTGQAIAITLIASGAAAAFCFFSAAGKEKKIIMSQEYDHFFNFFRKILIHELVCPVYGNIRRT